MIAAALLMLAVPVVQQDDGVGRDDGRLVIDGAETAATACYHHARRGDVQQDAADVCTRALETTRLPLNRTASIVNRGVVHYNGGRYAKAAADFGRAIDRGTRNARVYVNRGLAYEQLGRTDARYDALARTDYEAALALRPGDRAATRRLEELGKPAIERTPLRSRMTA